MPLELLNLVLHLPTFALVAARLAGLILLQPVFAGLAIPVRIKAVLVIGLAAVMTPLAGRPPESISTAIGLALALGGEFGIGALLGLAARAIFVGIETAGTLIAQESGLAYGRIADPVNGVDSDIISAFYVQLSSVLFLLVGGHRTIISATLDSFGTVPLLSSAASWRDALDLALDCLGTGSSLAVRVAAPAVLTMMLVNVALGFVARTVPQLNVTTVGFTLKGLFGFLIIAISLPGAMDLMSDSLGQALADVDSLLRAAVPAAALAAR